MKSKDFVLIRSLCRHKSDYVPLQTVDKQQIVIKSSKSSPRLEYVLDFIFHQFFNASYQIIQDSDTKEAQLNYTQSQQGLTIYQSDYLFGNQILPEAEDINPDSENFDLFAFVFFQLTRAEEYQYNSEDKFGRFPSTASRIKENLSKPTIDILLLDLAEKINRRFGILVKRKEKFRLIHTVDVDQFYAYKHKNLKRSVGGLVSNVLNADLDRLKDRSKSLAKGVDPYDSFDLLQKGAEGAEAHYFILVGNYNQLDNALEIEKEEIQAKLNELSKTAELGIHPSLESNKNTDLLSKEINRLEQVISDRPRNSRQHFLSLDFPNTYRALIDNGIKHDYSLGYHDRPGFRAGTTNPFYWFDLEKNESTDLMIHPLLVMDVSLKKYMQLDADEALESTKKLIDSCKDFQGPFCLLWHNSSFYSKEGWGGWEETYWGIVNYCKQLSA